MTPSRLFTADAMLKTRERNQKEFTASEICVPVWVKENCSVVAVTAEKKVATVDRLRRFAATCFCAKRMVGIPKFLYVLSDESLCCSKGMRTDLEEHRE